MNDWVEYTAKTVDDAITEAILNLKTTSDRMEYEVLEKESKGVLGLFAKPARIRVRLKKTVEGTARVFLEDMFGAMKIKAEFSIQYDEAEKNLDVEIQGEEMGILIGKRGQTLDAIQYLTSLVVNKETDEYLKVKVDTENYRQRRKETLESLARNIAAKVKRTRRPVSLEPMNSFERRIIHSALQGDNAIETHSEGEEPYRKVVIALKKTARDSEGRRGGKGTKKEGQKERSTHGYYKKPYRKDFEGKPAYRKDYKKPNRVEDSAPADGQKTTDAEGHVGGEE